MGNIPLVPPGPLVLDAMANIISKLNCQCLGNMIVMIRLAYLEINLVLAFKSSLIPTQSKTIMGRFGRI